jgi:hypothetical protein
VKDPSGAVVSKAAVELTSTAMAGAKALETDSSGYYRFANLPPGTYTLTVKAAGFNELKHEGINIEVGHLPTLDVSLTVGAAGTVVEVTGAAPLVDVTTNTNQTNVTQDVITEVPHGYSYQSVIQFAPMARNEPLAGGSTFLGAGGSGGSFPGSSGNGGAVGYSVGGAADSENSYLVEGQDTENISGGASAANVPFPFIQEVQVKSSGIEAEHGGALGGVVNVVMKKGSNGYHGSLFGTYEPSALDGSPNAALRYDPTPAQPPAPGFDLDAQTYVPRRDHYRIAQPGFTVGGPIVKDRLWFFVGFAPQYNSVGRTVNFGPPICASLGGCPNQALGNQYFTQDNQQYFGTARIDATLSQKVRLFGSWLYQYTRETGASLPGLPPGGAGNAPGNEGDSIAQQGYENPAIFAPLTQFSHGIGYSAPNATYNVGADITLTQKLVATTRFGYFFQNYHDFGWPTSGVQLNWQQPGTGVLDNQGNPLPAALQLPGGSTTAPYDPAYTVVNASKHYQFNEDLAFFKGGWGGTHNFKFGYQLNRLSNVINQNGNLPFVFIDPGVPYSPSTTFGRNNCALLQAEYNGNCSGLYGYAIVEDFATVLLTSAGKTAPAVDWNHAFFVQDAWTVGHGLTLNLGLRVEKESLPAPAGIGVAIHSINFSWSDKIEPRLGAAWGSKDGKLKIFGSYGVTNDVMKLLLAQTSFGAQGYENCVYALGPDGSGGFASSDITATFVAGRACPTALSNVGANFTNGTTPASFSDSGSGVSLIENVNFRPEEPVAPGVKPYRQHEIVAGVDYRIGKDWAFEARYDRRRLDHVIEDASLADPNAFEIYNIVNPGQGVNKTVDGYANYLRSIGDAYGPGTAAFDPSGTSFGTCPTCPNNPTAIRNYDGLEFRLSKTLSRGLSGSFSYTWSRLWGNYTGLTTTDQLDGGVTGRNSPNTTRAFDEPFYYFSASGKSNSGPLPTDRPNVFKAYAYYTLPWRLRSQATTFGLFQVAYQGSPLSTFSDIGLGSATPIEGTYILGHGNWANATTDANGNITLGTPYARRTPWYTQTDFNLSHSIKVNKNNEAQVLSFQASFTNLLNQHSVTSYWEGLNSNHASSSLFPFSIFGGAAFYQQIETGYNLQSALGQAQNGGVVLSSLYGRPNQWQISRHVRFGATFTF